MAHYVEELPEQVFADCRAVIFILETSSHAWSEVVENGGLSHVQVIQHNTRQNLLFRIRGRLEKTGQIVINVVLEKDVTYEVVEENKACHHLRSKNNVFLLRLSQDSNGDQFAVVVRNILRRIQAIDNSPSSPREAWMPEPVKQQPLPVQSQPIKDQLLKTSAVGKKAPLRPQNQSRYSDSSPIDRTLSVSSLSLAPSRVAQRENYEGQVDTWCDRLSNAILDGDVNTAAVISTTMAEQRLSLSIKMKNPKVITVNGGDDSFNLRVVVEDRETSGGVFAMKVSSTTKIVQLQNEVAERYGFPPKVQKWIVGKKMAKPTDTLAELFIRQAGFTAFLYLVAGQTVGLKRQEFEHYVNMHDERKKAGLQLSIEVRTGGNQSPVPSGTVGLGAQLSRAVSLPSLPTMEQSSEASINAASIAAATRSSNPVPGQAPVVNPPQTGNPVAQGIFAASSIDDLQHMLATFGSGMAPSMPVLQPVNERPSIGVEESAVEPQGWKCIECTYVNTPTRPGCEICGANRPEDYVVPQNPRITDQERTRLENERQEAEIFQRTLNQQQQEQEVAREMNFRQLVQTAQQSLISNTEEFDCAICYTTVVPGEGVMLRECLHCFCRDCLREHIRNCTDPEVQCPFQDNEFACHFVITAQEIKALLPEQDFNRFLHRSLVTAESQAANSFHCKTPNCPGWCIYEDNSNIFHCPVCQKVNCLTCKAIHHPEMNCKEYQEDLQRRAQNDDAAKQTQKFLEQMIAKGDAMKCPQCEIILLKKDGCDWMRCSMCRMEICWATRGPRWGPQGVGDLTGGCKCRVGGKKCHPKCRNCH